VADKVRFDLQERLDQYGQRFPHTQSGVEIKVLEKLVSEGEAEMSLEFGLMLGTSYAVAQLQT
jgi:electron transport complex protein RnfB